ncbi:MAG: chorismate synthase [Lachnospiraceae bacterium]|nr:chorismate synthase [Lachnospiraceae bacterium]
MSGSVFGTIFRISTWGESHGTGVGVVVDGCPAGLELSEQDIQVYLNRRKPGQSRFSTPRSEEDAVEILSGVFEGRTTGTPISMVVYNKTQRSGDYSEIASYYRPGHADYTFDKKYGFRDYRGGGRSSGRETIARVAAGAVAAKLLKELGVTVQAYTYAIGNVEIDYGHFDGNEIYNNMLYMPDAVAAERASVLLDEKRGEGDSVGGVVECVISGLKAGIGEPVFEKLDANLAKAVVSIGAVKAVEIGDGCQAAKMLGSWNNDFFRIGEDGQPVKATNHAGGILGGISDGSDVLLKAYFKPTPSIFKKQQTVNRAGENIEIQIKGRHDPIIVPRAVVVVESMAALTVLDLMLMSMTSDLNHIRTFFDRL